MPKIRSITLGLRPGGALSDELARAGEWLAAARAAFEQAGFEVQTVRASLPPLAELAVEPSAVTRLAAEAEAALDRPPAPDYVAFGPLRADEPARFSALASAVPDAICSTSRVFFSLETVQAGRVSFLACEAAGRIVRRVADLSEAGFGNLRFTAAAGCPADVPFFPVAYHEEHASAFGIALEAADLAGQALGGGGPLSEAEAALARSVQALAERVEAVARRLEAETGVRYVGADLTPAPFPSDEASAAGALERLGVGTFGAPGTLLASALWTRALRRVGARAHGFDGLMLPVMEDSVLARRAGEGSYGWQALLLYSAVCGTGLDTLPLPGDVTAETLGLIAADVASLSVALGKPLTCRLFPIPGKTAGEMTAYDFPYFANAAVLPVAPGSRRLLERGLLDERA